MNSCNILNHLSPKFLAYTNDDCIYNFIIYDSLNTSSKCLLFKFFLSSQHQLLSIYLLNTFAYFNTLILRFTAYKPDDFPSLPPWKYYSHSPLHLHFFYYPIHMHIKNGKGNMKMPCPTQQSIINDSNLSLLLYQLKYECTYILLNTLSPTAYIFNSYHSTSLLTML